MPVLSRPAEWRPAIFGVCRIEIDILSLQKHLHNPLIPILSCPAEWRQAIFGVWCIGIGILSLEKDLYYLLIPSFGRPGERCPASCVVCRMRPYQRYIDACLRQS